MKSFTLAVIQNRPGYDIHRNVDTAIALIERAATRGAELACLPEIFVFPYELARLAGIADASYEIRSRLQETARRLGLYLCTGSIPEKEGERVWNRAYLIDPDGNILHTYSKSHLFDVDLPGVTVRESAAFTPGDALGVVETPLATIGILICYDIRFPEAARKLALSGAELLLVPAAFNTVTGPAHWRPLFRTRAIENQCFVAAASPARTPGARYRAYGHSLIADPWGRVLAEAGSGQAVLIRRLDAEVFTRTRARLPLLSQRRPELY
ncbi:MAG TPA: carbon-nitrogen hydrolase family protein [Spirochaetia bacterium]|nr:carbon-nitrogen hydrolase family protein [Spirochaetia bacterium]